MLPTVVHLPAEVTAAWPHTENSEGPMSKHSFKLRAVAVCILVLAGVVLPQPAGAAVGLYDIPEQYLASPVDDTGAFSGWAYASYLSVMNYRLKQGWTTPLLNVDDLVFNHGFEYGPNDGGQWYMSTAYMSRLSGPLTAITGQRDLFLTGSIVYEGQAAMKAAVESDRALYVDVYDDVDVETRNYIDTATIVGYDDSITSWKIRSQAGDSYVPYAQCDTYGVSFETAENNIVTGAYQYDYFGQVTYMQRPAGIDTLHVANKFHTSAEEELAAVGFYTIGENVGYELRIYGSHLLGGAPQNHLLTMTGTIANEGFHVVDLEQIINLASGQDFMIWLKLDNYLYAVDMPDEDYCGSVWDGEGMSIYTYTGDPWYVLSDYYDSANWSIKAYTIPEPGTLALVAAGGAALLLRRKRIRLR